VTHPLVAQRLPADNQWSGVWIAEDIQLLTQGIRNGSWIDGTLGGVSAALDGLALVSDPVGVLLQYGVAWLIEHVRPLSEALDWLAGDPAQIAANAQTWRNIAGELRGQATELNGGVSADLARWTGGAADEYRAWSVQQQSAISGLADAAETMAVATEAAGFLIAGVRLLVRDAIATVVSRLIVYAIEELASLGFATPLVVEQVVTLVGSWAARIARWLRGLIQSLRNLLPIVRRGGELIDQLKAILSRMRQGVEQFPALHRVSKRGAGPIQLFNLGSVRTIAAKYGIDISNLTIRLGDKAIRGICGRTNPDGSIVLFVHGFRSEEDLARTLVHEIFHRNELAAGKPFPRTDAEFDLWEDLAYAHEDLWWQSQPVRPEPRSR
jgi:uncharacterized protein YukE